jgi:outer membrane lipoprotein
MNNPIPVIQAAGPTRKAVGVLISCAIVGLLLGSCAHSPVSSNESGPQISSLTVAEARNIDALEVVNGQQQGAEHGVKDTVRWGGTITRIQNTADDLTEVEIVGRPLTRSGRPVHNDRSDGRFIARVREFLDPQIITTGRDMTVVGTFDGLQEGVVGEASYVFPVVEVQDFTYWRKVSPQPQRHFRHWNDRGPLHYDPFWPRWILYHPHRHTR